MIPPDALARLEALADALGLDGLEHPEIHDVFYVFMNETGETDLRALLAERKALVEALEEAGQNFATIWEYPIPEQDNMIAANMRKIARDALER